MKKMWAIGLIAALLVGLMVVGAPDKALAQTTHWVNDDDPNAGGYIPPGSGCGGPGYSTIQAAVDAAMPGDTVTVCAGTYYETVTIRSDDNNLDLVGKGATIANNGALSVGINILGGAHHISISGFEIKGFSADWGAGIEREVWMGSDPLWSEQVSHITIRHNDIHGNYDGINIVNWNSSTWGPPGWRHNNLTIQHNNIYENSYRGISWWGVADSTIAHNVIQDNGQDGITWVGVQDSTATHNQINGNNTRKPEGLLGVGLSINEGSSGNTVTHNDIRNNVNLGILLTGWNSPTGENTFVQNDARDNASWDIREFTTSGGVGYPTKGVGGNTWVKNKYDDANPNPPQ